MKSESQVAKARESVLKFSDKKISKAFITKHRPYLILGERIWWKGCEREYQFFDGESYELRPMPHLLHFRLATLKDVYRQSTCWETIVEEKIGLPTSDLYEEVSLAPTQLQDIHTTQPHKTAIATVNRHPQKVIYC